MEEPVCLILSMENGLLPNCCKGGLGILEADKYFQAVDENYPLIFVSLFYPYKSKQVKVGEKVETKLEKTIANKLVDTGVEINLNSRWYPASLRIFEYPSNSRSKAFFLNPGLEENEKWLRELEVYGERDLGQLLFTRYLLAEGAIKLVEEFCIYPKILHLEESDTALVVRPASRLEEKPKIVFTIHTPLPHGHKSFPLSLVQSLYGEIPREFEAGIEREYLNLTKLASHYAERIYTVSKIQEEIEKRRQPYYAQKISSISNAVHKRWINSHLQKLFDEEIDGWRQNVLKLREVHRIDDEKIEKALELARNDLEEKFEVWYENGEIISNFTSIPPNSKIFTFAKRITEYKRQKDFLRIAKDFDSNSVCIFSGPLIGKYGEEFLEEFYEVVKNENPKVAYVLNFDENKAFHLVSGSDFWVNIPIAWAEASGTSHMKASLNGRPPISTSSGTVPEYIKHEYNGILVQDSLEDLFEKIKLCERMGKENYLRLSVNCMASSPYILMERMFEEFLNDYKNIAKVPVMISERVISAPAGI